MPDVVFHLKTNENICYSRLQKRGFPLILDNLDRTKTLERLSYMNKLIQIAINDLSSRGVKVITIINDSSKKSNIQSNIRDLLDTISKYDKGFRKNE